MAYEMRELTGSMFKNKDKQEGDTRPNAKGSCLIEGVEYWVDAWTKKDKNGNPWQSLSFKKKEKQGAKPAKASREPGEDDDDGPPF